MYKCPPFLIFVAFAILQACSKKKEAPAQGAYQLSLPVITVTPADYVGYDAFPATVEGVRTVPVMAKVAGYIDSVWVDEGDYVRKGQRLFVQESNALGESVAAAFAAIKTAKANVETAKIEVERLTPLVREKVVGPVQLLTAEASLQASIATYEQAKRDYESQLAMVDYTEVLSPVDGVVGPITWREGTLVGPSSTNAVMSLSAIDSVYIYFALSEQRILRIMNAIEGKTLNKKVQDMPRVRFEMANGKFYGDLGDVRSTTSDVNPMTGSVRLRATFQNPDGLLRNGSTGKIHVPKPYKQVLAVPEVVTFETQDQKKIFVVGPQGKLEERVIKIAGIVPGFFIVDGGLKSGEKVLAKGIIKVRPGMSIKPIPVKADSIAKAVKTVFN
ncbi:RND transporter (plasmid) [Fulvitalea axinellae]|uniref:RND transporter n=1 Tax=Fulvitalea axinellae TaxID=1182444 RepID=A0AAU9CI75_9BACT|nr:RND transporter [Fulvitalea axinellae]